MKIIDKTFQYASVDTFMQELKWPTQGTTRERISSFMVNCYDVERRLVNGFDPFVRHKFNRAIFRIVPNAFGLKPDQADNFEFNSLQGIENILTERSWSVHKADNDKAVKFGTNRVKSVETK